MNNIMSHAEKKNPILKYKYIPWHISGNNDQWAELAYETEEARLDIAYCNGLEKIYSSAALFVRSDHKTNIAFLKKLQYLLDFVWASKFLLDANMEHLVEDYKNYFDLE